MKMIEWIGFRKVQKLALKEKIPEDGLERDYTEKLRNKQSRELVENTEKGFKLRGIDDD